MLEIVPLGTSKGSGVRTLLDHLNVPVQEVHTNKFCSLTSDFLFCSFFVFVPSSKRMLKNFEI